MSKRCFETCYKGLFQFSSRYQIFNSPAGAPLSSYTCHINTRDDINPSFGSKVLHNATGELFIWSLFMDKGYSFFSPPPSTLLHLDWVREFVVLLRRLGKDVNLQVTLCHCLARHRMAQLLGYIFGLRIRSMLDNLYVIRVGFYSEWFFWFISGRGKRGSFIARETLGSSWVCFS